MKPVAVPNLAYRLTTAEILYHLPDHPHVLQSFVWQQMDLAPDFPALHRFLTHWRTRDRRQASFRHGGADPDPGPGRIAARCGVAPAPLTTRNPRGPIITVNDCALAAAPPGMVEHRTR